MAAIKLSNTWETVATGNNVTAIRLRVSGGWIVHMLETTSNTTTAVFVSDPKWEWIPSADTDPE